MSSILKLIARTRPISVGFFLILAAISWYALTGYAIRYYVSIILLLFGVQIFLSDLLELFLVYGFKLRRRWFNLLIAPGTIIHELSHMFTAIFTGATILEVSLFNFNPQRGVLGYVKYSQTRDKWLVFRDLLIAFSPFFGCGIIFLILDFIQHPTTTLFSLVDIAGAESILVVSELFIRNFFAAPTILAFFLLYLKFCMALGSAPSSYDFKGILSSLFYHPISSLFLIIIGVSVLFLSESDLVLGYYHISDMIMVMFKAFTVILLASSLVLLVSLPLILFSIKLYELAQVERIIVVSAPLAAYLGNLNLGITDNSTMLAISFAIGFGLWIAFKYKTFFVKPLSRTL